MTRGSHLPSDVVFHERKETTSIVDNHSFENSKRYNPRTEVTQRYRLSSDSRRVIQTLFTFSYFSFTTTSLQSKIE